MKPEDAQKLEAGTKVYFAMTPPTTILKHVIIELEFRGVHVFPDRCYCFDINGTLGGSVSLFYTNRLFVTEGEARDCLVEELSDRIQKLQLQLDYWKAYKTDAERKPENIE